MQLKMGKVREEEGVRDRGRPKGERVRKKRKGRKTVKVRLG